MTKQAASATALGGAGLVPTRCGSTANGGGGGDVIAVVPGGDLRFDSGRPAGSRPITKPSTGCQAKYVLDLSAHAG